MSTWNLGANDVSEETRNFRDKLASKDGQIAAQEDRLLRQAAELEEMQEKLNEALYKLNSETRRALQLEDDLKQRNDELRNEKIASENVQTALTNALQKSKGSSMELRELEATLDRISRTSDEHLARGMKLEKEKSALEARVRELESNLLNASQFTPAPKRVANSRPRSSSLSNFRITTLEQDLEDFKSQLANKEAEIAHISQQLSRARQECNKAENELVASEKRWQAQIDELESQLEDKDDEMNFLKTQGAEGSREEELLKRIEEDDARIGALEALCRGADDSRRLKEKIKRLEAQLDSEQRRCMESEEKLAEVAREKEGAVNALEESHEELVRLTSELEERQRAIQDSEDKMATSSDDDLLPGLEAASTRSSPMDTEPDTIEPVEKLLLAIDRLRGERDGLRRDLEFLEFESKFAIEALEQKLALSASEGTETQQTVNSLGQIKNEMDELHSHLQHTTERHAVALRCRDTAYRQLSLYSQGLAIVIDHLANEQVDQMIQSDDLDEANTTIQNLQDKYRVSLRMLEEATCERDNLLAKLQQKDAMADRHELEAEVADLNAHIDHVESDRDSLALQVTNLTMDLESTQDQLKDAEDRYNNLQCRQLSSMPSNEATYTLRQHIEELEARVMRRTEQIGIHQHDIRRLETNLRLQEERLTEMTTELEMMAAQKDAMVEDCAYAREARDETLARVEALEDELEANVENEVLVTSLIGVVFDTASRARDAVRRSNVEASTLGTRIADQQRQHESLMVQLDDKESALRTMTQLANQYREDLERANESIASSQDTAKSAMQLEEKLRGEIETLQAELSAIHAQNHESTIRDLQCQETELEMRLEAVETVGADHEAARKTLVELKIQHTEALAILQEQLAKSEASFQELHARFESVSAEQATSMEISRTSLVEVQKQLDDAKSKLSALEQGQQVSETVSNDQVEKIAALEAELETQALDYQSVMCEREVLETAKKQLQDEIDQLRREQDTVVSRLEEENASIQEELERKLQTLQGRFEEESRLLGMSKQETARLANRLDEVAEGHIREQEDREADLLAARQDVARLEEQVQGLQQEIDDCRAQLEDRDAQAQHLEQEKVALQQDLTSLEAEVQKSKSLNRYLETQVKDSELAYPTLKGDLEQLKEDLARSEKACKAAEVNLSLQNAQQKRETSELQRQLSNMQSRPNLEGALAELEERNTEMEELLKAKCAEIEANDDRVLEMLKEKKKLSAKVEALNRKVQNLQAKLNAAKATANAQAASPPPEVPAPAVPRKDSPPTTSSRPRPMAVIQESASTSVVQPSPANPLASRRSSSRVVSSSNSGALARPKTPERSRNTAPSPGLAPAPVFKARTPEQLPAPPRDPLPTEPVIGRKRPAPDDFDGSENVPTQAFLPNGKDAENRTPRVRRVLSSLQSGFTPNRHHNRQTAPMPSPKRPQPPPSTSKDTPAMTTNPFSVPSSNPASSTKPSSKRSWLGKIRGSAQVPERSSTRTFFGPGPGQ